MPFTYRTIGYCQSLEAIHLGGAFLRLRDRVGGLTRLEDTSSTTMCGTSRNHSKALGLGQWACRNWCVMPVKQASNLHFQSTDAGYTSIYSCSLHRYENDLETNIDDGRWLSNIKKLAYPVWL